jgi:hypothetical protein
MNALAEQLNVTENGGPDKSKFDQEWRKVMQEPLPLYFNRDGSRTPAA